MPEPRISEADRMPTAKELKARQREELPEVVKARLQKNMHRHKKVDRHNLQAQLDAQTAQLWSPSGVGRTGGEPDVVRYDQKADEYTFMDCSAESPKGRRSICYAREALESRKEHKPADNALDMAAAMGIELLT